MLDFHRQLVYEWFELDPDDTTRRRFQNGLLGLARGSAKTQLLAWVGAACLFQDVWDPNHTGSCVGTLAATTWDQAALLHDATADALRLGPMGDLVDCFDAEIVRKDGNGRVHRIAAAAGSAEGGRPNFVVLDELHELGTKERLYTVLSASAAKMRNGWTLAITTAGADIDSLAGRLYQKGRAMERGEVSDKSFWFRWFEAPAETRIDDDESFIAGLRSANPGLGIIRPVESWLSLRGVVPDFELRRYGLNQWVVGGDESWVSSEAWNSSARADLSIPPGSRIYLGVDMALSGDTAAVVVCWPHLDGETSKFAVQARIFEKPDGDDTLDTASVEFHIRQLAQQFDVAEAVFDPAYFEAEAARLLDDGVPMVRFPQSPSRMIPAVQRAHRLISTGQVIHPGDTLFTRHILDARPRYHDAGWTLRKPRAQDGNRRRHIDGAVAMVLALSRASMPVERQEQVAPAVFVFDDDDVD